MENTSQKRIECVVNSHLFGGYTQTIDLSEVQSIEEIIGIVISTMFSIFNTYNFNGLITHLNDLTFHVEKITFDDLKEGRVDKIIIKEDDHSSSED